MNRSIFYVIILCIAFISCENNKNAGKFNIIGNWYVSQCYGSSEYQYTEIYKYDDGRIKEVPLNEKNELAEWNDNYDYGENIVIFNNDRTVLINAPDLNWNLSGSYILDNENEKIILISENKSNKIYSLSGESNSITISKEYNHTLQSSAIKFMEWPNGGEGVKYTYITEKEITCYKLKRIN